MLFSKPYGMSYSVDRHRGEVGTGRGGGPVSSSKAPRLGLFFPPYSNFPPSPPRLGSIKVAPEEFSSTLRWGLVNYCRRYASLRANVTSISQHESFASRVLQTLFCGAEDDLFPTTKSSTRLFSHPHSTISTRQMHETPFPSAPIRVLSTAG